MTLVLCDDLFHLFSVSVLIWISLCFQVVARHEDLLAQATGIESLEGEENSDPAPFTLFIRNQSSELFQKIFPHVIDI